MFLCTQLCLASAFSNNDREAEALKVYELIQTQLNNQGTTTWKTDDVVSLNING